jgi:uncharacterized glyoxalase superfamily protein PhnB
VFAYALILPQGTFQQALKKEPWGAKTFVVADPDENLILFAGPAVG